MHARQIEGRLFEMLMAHGWVLGYLDLDVTLGPIILHHKSLVEFSLDAALSPAPAESAERERIIRRKPN